MVKIDPRNIIIVVLVAAIVFLMWPTEPDTTELDNLNKEYERSKVVFQSRIDSIQAIQDSVRVVRDTLYIYIKDTDEKTSQEIARIDTTHVDSLVIELSNRYD